MQSLNDVIFVSSALREVAKLSSGGMSIEDALMAVADRIESGVADFKEGKTKPLTSAELMAGQFSGALKKRWF